MGRELYRWIRGDGKILAQAIAALTVGQVSKLLLVKETPYLVRITSERDVPARPLSEVSDTVRKALAPQQLKQSIEQVGKEVLAKAAVEYKTTPAEDQTPAGKHP